MKFNEIYLGDCLKLCKDLPDKSITSCFTSPPYNRIRDDTYEEYHDNLTDYKKMLTHITREMLRICKGNVIINIQSNAFNKKEVNEWKGIFKENIVGDVVWVKRNPQPAGNYRESEGDWSVTNAYENFYILRDGTDEFRAYEKITNVIITNVNEKHIRGHGAIMKEEVADHFIKSFTRKGDVVIDPFMGTGTTAISCKKLGRQYIGFEIAEKYWAIAKARTSGGGNMIDFGKEIVEIDLRSAMKKQAELPLFDEGR